MPRSKAYEPEIVLERAMVAFWNGGFSGTSTQELMTSMGLGKRSLYDEFGDKHSLYVRALREYIAKVEAMHQAAVDSAPAGLSALRAVLEATLDLGPETPTGCFAVSAAMDLAPSDLEVAELVDGYFGRSERMIRSLVYSIPGAVRTDRESVADVIHSSWVGLRVRLRAGLTPGERSRQIDDILELAA